MQKTEVTLGADSQKTATTVDMPSNSNLGKRPLLCAAGGAVLGYLAAKHFKKEGNKKVIYVVVGGLIGFVAGKYWQSHRKVVIKPSK